MGSRPVSGNIAFKPADPDNSLISVSEESASLTESEQRKDQAETAALLADEILRYTAGESCSVTEDTAARILGSIYYSIEARTATLDSPGALLRELRGHGVRGIYREGIKIVRACLEETKALFQKVSDGKLDVPLAPYNEMIDTAIPEFLRTYNVEFNAQSIDCCMDYPLAFDDNPATGIFFLNRYLKNLLTETEFCACFPRSDILRTLFGYQVKYEIDVTDAPLNLFTLLFDQSVFAVLAGNETDGFTVTPEQALKLTETLAGLKDREIRERIADAVTQISARLPHESPELRPYLLRCQTQLTDRVLQANGYGNLLNLVLIKGEDPSAGQDVFTDGERLEDWKFTHLTELVGECESTEEKIRLILSNIRSSKDFVDLLEADCLYGDEFKRLYGALGDTELALLGKSVFSDELRQDRLRLTASLLEQYRKNAEQDWQAEYADFLKGLPDERKSAVENLVNNLNVKRG